MLTASPAHATCSSKTKTVCVVGACARMCHPELVELTEPSLVTLAIPFSLSLPGPQGAQGVQGPTGAPGGLATS